MRKTLIHLLVDEGPQQAASGTHEGGAPRIIGICVPVIAQRLHELLGLRQSARVLDSTQKLSGVVDRYTFQLAATVFCPQDCCRRRTAPPLPEATSNQVSVHCITSLCTELRILQTPSDLAVLRDALGKHLCGEQASGRGRAGGVGQRRHVQLGLRVHSRQQRLQHRVAVHQRQRVRRARACGKHVQRPEDANRAMKTGSTVCRSRQMNGGCGRCSVGPRRLSWAVIYLSGVCIWENSVM